MEEMLFLSKKIISVFLYPIGWVLLLLIVGMMTLLFNRSRRIAIACVGGNPPGQRDSGLQIGVIRSLRTRQIQRADSMSLLPLEMGLPKDSLIIMTTARDSDDEAKSFSELLGKQPFALETSAYHIPRSLKMFSKLSHARSP